MHWWHLLAVLAFLVTGCRAAEPPAELAARIGNLNGVWRFSTDPAEAGDQAGWALPQFDDSGWRTLTVPGHWESQGVTDPRPGQPPKPLNGLPFTDYDGLAWYRLTVVVPEAWRGQPLVLLLGAVDDDDVTWLNGRRIGASHEVSTKRRYQVPAEVVRWGQTNTLAIAVTDGGGPGGLEGPQLSLLPEEALMVKPLPAEDRPFAERFADPPGSARILKIVHAWPLGAAAELDQIAELRRLGFGGAATNVGPWNENYLHSAPHWDQLRRVTSEAKRLGMTLWLYDEMGYPSGTAGGQVLKDHPEWAAEGLLVATASGPGTLSVSVPPGKLVLAQAAPRGDLSQPVDLRDQVSDGKLSFAAPAAGDWQLVVMTRDYIYEGTHASLNVFEHQKYTNLLLPEPTKRFIELTHDSYARELGDLSKLFAATFTDEPSLMSCFLRQMPYGVLPWADNLAPEFARRRGYDLLPKLAGLALEGGAATQRLRYDFWQTVADLVSENYFGQIQARCRELGVPAGGHLLMEESFRGDVLLYGDLFACARRLDAPSIDILTSIPGQVPWSTARLLASVAELRERPLVMSEASDHSQRHRPPGDQRPPEVVTADQIRGSLGRQMAGGVNTFTSYYTFDQIAPDEMVRLNEYVGRLCTGLQGGHQVADVAVLYPVQSLWPHTLPSRTSASPDVDSIAIEQAYNTTLNSLFESGRDACIIDAQALVETKVAGQQLHHGQLAWSVLILPAVETLPDAAWDRIRQFWQAGGNIIGVGRRGRNTPTDFPSAQAQALGEELFGTGGEVRAARGPNGGTALWLPPGSEALLAPLLDQLIERDVATAPDSALRTTHRRIDGHEVYLVLNDSEQAFEGTVTVAAEGRGELCDPTTGQISPLAGPVVDLALQPYHAVLLRFATALPRLVRELPDGALALGTPQPVPATVPEPGAGEFVRSEPVAAVTAPDGGPAWRFTGVLTKSQTDTFLFAQFKWPTPQDLSAGKGLRVPLNMPEGQDSPASVFAVVITADGGQYIASVGRLLNEPGWRTSTIPWSSFAKAGWSNSGASTLDPSAVRQINLGWGGYLGQEGERLTFDLALPSLFVLKP